MFNVGAGDRKGGGGNVGGADLGGGRVGGEGEGEAAGAGAEIEGLWRFPGGRHGKQKLPGEFGEGFSFGAGDEDSGRDGEFESAKGDGAGDVLQRLALAAALDERAESGEFGFSQKPLEIEVEFHARHLEDVREEKFDLEAGGINAAFGEVIGAALDGFQDGHAERVRG